MLRLKNPLGGNSELSPYGDKNVIEGVQVDGVDLIPDATKKVNIKGKYAKPADGIPKSDLSSGVQESLEKADSAIQQHQDISSKVDKENGKGLSTNDFTDELKKKLEDIESNADVNIIEGVQVDGVDLVPNGNKKVNIDLSDKVVKVAGKGLSTNDFDNIAKQKVTDAYVKPQTGIPKSDLASDVTSHWNLLGETLLTDNTSVTGLTVTPTGKNAGFLQNYSKFKVVIEITPADTTATVFNPKLYFRRNGGLSGRIYESPGISFGSLKLQSDNKFYAVFILEKMTDDIMQTTLMPQGNNYTGQATFFGGQVFGAFTTDVSSILADDIFFRNFESTASISTGSSMKLYAWEE